MEKVPLQDILESIRRELENLKGTESESSIYADVFIAGTGSTMNLIRCIHTALATGADPRRVRLAALWSPRRAKSPCSRSRRRARSPRPACSSVCSRWQHAAADA